MTRSSIANIEAGRQNIGIDALLSLATVLGTTAAALLGEAPTQPIPTVEVQLRHAVVCETCGVVVVFGPDQHTEAMNARRAHLDQYHLPGP